MKGKVCKDRQKANPCTIAFADQKVIPTDPPDSCCLGDVLMGEMASLTLPVDELGGGYRESSISKILDCVCQDKPQGVEKNVHPLVMVKVERSRSVFNVIQDGIGEVIPD